MCAHDSWSVREKLWQDMAKKVLKRAEQLGLYSRRIALARA
jgi:hypothetical protein